MILADPTTTSTSTTVAKTVITVGEQTNIYSFLIRLAFFLAVIVCLWLYFHYTHKDR